MATKTPQETASAAVEAGTTKAKLRWDKALVGGFLAGAYSARAWAAPVLQTVLPFAAAAPVAFSVVLQNVL